MNTLPTKNFYHDGIYIVRGLKDEQGKLYTFVKTNSKYDITEVSIDSTTIISEFEPVPYSEFTSLDDDFTKGYERTYIKVKLKENLTSEQINGMSTTGIRYYQFGEREVKVLGEFNSPFQYTLNYLKSGEGNFGVYGPTTWLIHDVTRGEEERKAMEEILNIAHEYYKTTPYSLDISLDSNTIQYISYLRELDNANKITYGDSGFVRISKEDVIHGDKEGYLAKEDILYLAKRISNVGVLFHHSIFTRKFYEEHIEGKPTEENFTTYLYEHEVKSISESGFDMSYLAERNIIKILDETVDSMDSNYELNKDVIRDNYYRPLIGHYDPYEYYCCPDCDGYYIESNDVPYDYEIDEQVELLARIMNRWSEYLSDEHLSLFSDWSSDIFFRYLNTYPDSNFVVKLKNTYC